MRVVLTSCPAAAADGLASALVEGRFAACVSILPGVVSTYRWEGAIQRDEEQLLLIKVPVRNTAALMAALAALHPYDVPEIIALPTAHVAAAYSAWATAQVEGVADTNSD